MARDTALLRPEARRLGRELAGRHLRRRGWRRYRRRRGSGAARTNCRPEDGGQGRRCRGIRGRGRGTPAAPPPRAGAGAASLPGYAVRAAATGLRAHRCDHRLPLRGDHRRRNSGSSGAGAARTSSRPSPAPDGAVSGWQRGYTVCISSPRHSSAQSAMLASTCQAALKPVTLGEPASLDETETVF